VLSINAAMFLVEIGAGVVAGSASLQADALDFLGDAANYSISLFVVGMALRYRATAAMLKGLTMGVFGFWIIGNGMPCTTRFQAPSRWALSASPPSLQMRSLSCSCGHTVKAMPTCDPHGFARATTFSETWLFCWLRWVFLVRARVGPMFLWPRLWRA
jgi:hypothetical protein